MAVFFLNRPGECSMTSGEPHPFLWYDIYIYMGQIQLDVFGAKASQFCVVDWYRMTFTVQKSGVPGEIVEHSKRRPPCVPCHRFGRDLLIATQAWISP